MENNLRSLRLKNNISISQLASLCGVSDSYIIKIEKGYCKISPSILEKIIKIFECEIEDVIMKEKSIKLSASDVTFANNKNSIIHRWYPYIEGFSQNFVENILKDYKKNSLVYDPFNGSGTTTLTCAFNGFKSIGCEINPFMRFIAETKVNSVKRIIDEKKIEKFKRKIEEFRVLLETNFYKGINYKKYIKNFYLEFNFFGKQELSNIAIIKDFYTIIDDEDISKIFKLALACILVECSYMIRSVDLRRKRANEINRIPKDMMDRYVKQLLIILNDIEKNQNKSFKETILIGDNAKKKYEKYKNKVDVIITSPPYVNGTNYFRNTKLELWILDFIDDENGVKDLRKEAITAGINNVSKSIRKNAEFSFVETYAKKLDKVAKDNRIPKLIRSYFSDMDIVFNNFKDLLRKDGKVFFDIGDSQYYGVYIPVDKIIIEIAKKNGFEVTSNEVIRNRKSKNGMILSQRLLIFKKR